MEYPGKPERKCIACQQTTVKNRLLRIVRSPGGKLSFDRLQKKSGRGFYLCPSIPCIEKAKGRHTLEKAAGQPVPLELYTELVRHVQHDSVSPGIEKLLPFAMRSGNVVTGITGVEQEARRNRIRLLIVDTSSGESTLQKVRQIGKGAEIPVILHDGEHSLEKLTGKPNCKCLGIRDPHFAEQMFRQFKRE